MTGKGLRGIFVAVVAVALLCGFGGEKSPGALVTVSPFTLNTGLDADAKLLTYWMPGVRGEPVEASTLLFTPRGIAPVGGWPIVAWAHGTTSLGAAQCAPSLFPELAGDSVLMGAEAAAGYVSVIRALLDAGYAVVAPDYEGLGAVATTPYPYFNLSSEGRSIVLAVRAARQAATALSSNWAVVGHSNGGHAVFGADLYAKEAPELSLKGSVAFAPGVAMEELVAMHGNAAQGDGPIDAIRSRIKQDILVSGMVSGVKAQLPNFDASAVFGEDMLASLPGLQQECVVAGSRKLFLAIVLSGGGGVAGVKPDWAKDPQMADFLLANDPAVMPDFALSKPSLILQGTLDGGILPAITDAFVAKLQSTSNAGITYKKFAANHVGVVAAGEADMLDFLHSVMR